MEVRATNNDYDENDPADPAGTLTSDEYNYLVGVEWDATAKTSGHVKLGMYDRQYDSGARQDEDGFTWEVGVDLAAAHLLRGGPEHPPLHPGDQRPGRRDQYPGSVPGLEPPLEPARPDHPAACATTTEDYQGADREDDNYVAEARYDYEYRRWLDLGVGYRYEDRDSDIDSFSFSDNIFFLEAKLSL